MAVLTETLAKLLFVGSLLTLIAVTDTSTSTSSTLSPAVAVTTSNSTIIVDSGSISSSSPAMQNNRTSVLSPTTPATISSTSNIIDISSNSVSSSQTTAATNDATTITVAASLPSSAASVITNTTTLPSVILSTSPSTTSVIISVIATSSFNVLNNATESSLNVTQPSASVFVDNSPSVAPSPSSTALQHTPTTGSNKDVSTAAAAAVATTVNLTSSTIVPISTTTTIVVPVTNLSFSVIVTNSTSSTTTASTATRLNMTSSVTSSTSLPTTTVSSITQSPSSTHMTVSTHSSTSTHTSVPGVSLSSSTPTASVAIRTTTQPHSLSSIVTSAAQPTSSSAAEVSMVTSSFTNPVASQSASSSPTTLTLTQTTPTLTQSGSATSISQASMSVSQTTVAVTGTNRVALGVGLGIGLGVPVIIILALIVFCCCKRKQEEMNRSGSRKLSSRLRWPFRYAPSRTTVPPRAGYDNLTADFMNDDIEMTFSDEVLAVPPARSSFYIDSKDFLEYVASRQANLATYHAEFASLPSKQIRSATDGQKSHNDTKNRYTNVLPFNVNRVTVGSNHYINASFIDGLNKKNVYIATQGPLQAAVADFWLMVWQYNCPKIVMVTNLEEGGRPKCYQYWPGTDVNEELYGDITVQLKEERAEQHWIERTFCLRKDTERRYVTQYQYTMWPDQDVPVNCSSILEFHDSVFKDDNKSRISGDSPIVVHCSAGVGRTGTFIAIDILLQQAQLEGRIDLMGCIDKLRRQRMMMVQSLAQFIFIHHAMLEALLLGQVAIPCPEFNLTAFELSHPVSSNDISTLQLQYDVLEVLKLQNNPGLFSTANCTDYKPKNRLSTLLPMDGYITFLTPTPEDSNIYINAVFVAGAQNNKEFIVTQLPLPNTTTTDFWRLVKDESCVAVVMLNNLNDRSEQYWPNDGKTLRSGQIEIMNVGEIVADEIQITDLQLVFSEKSSRQRDSDGRMIRQHSPGVTAKTNNTLTVRHLRLLNWTDDSPVPDDKSTLLELCEQVALCQHKNPGGKILVHCLYGAERSGLFCALLNVICGIRLGGEVDVFNAVKLIRRSRPEFITSLHQYKLLYELAAAFVAADKQSSANYSLS